MGISSTASRSGNKVLSIRGRLQDLSTQANNNGKSYCAINVKLSASVMCNCPASTHMVVSSMFWNVLNQATLATPGEPGNKSTDVVLELFSLKSMQILYSMCSTNRSSCCMLNV